MRDYYTGIPEQPLDEEDAPDCSTPYQREYDHDNDPNFGNREENANEAA
jgi:hypothetical protein